MAQDTHSRLVDLLRSNNARFRIIEHEPEGRSEHISRIRGNHPSQAMKAIVASVRGGGKGKRTVLAVIPGNRRLNMKALVSHLAAQKGSFANSDLAQELTGCVMGAVPPFSFRDDLPLIVDTAVDANDEVVFNAGRLDRSIFVQREDYLAITKPARAEISERPDEN